MRMILILVFVMISGCAKDFEFNPYTTILKQIHKAQYDEKRVRSLETFKEKHPRN
jgi:hypothetical protein